MSTQFNCVKHFYFKLFSLFKQFNLVSIIFVHTVKCQNSSIKKNQYGLITVSISKTVPIQINHFCISTQFSSICPIDRNLSGATTLSHSEPGNEGNGGVLRIPQSSNITGASSSD